METRDFENVISQQELEQALRIRLEARQNDYRRAAARYARLLQEMNEGLTPYQGGVMARAREVATQAFDQQTRIMRIFTELTVHRKVTEETLQAAFGQVTNTPLATTIAVIDDDESVRAATRSFLRSASYSVESFNSANLFLASGALRRCACLLVDLRMPEIDGFELQRQLNEVQSRVPIIFISVRDDLSTKRKAIEAGAVDFLSKPFEGTALLAAIEAALQRNAQAAITSGNG